VVGTRKMWDFIQSAVAVPAPVPEQVRAIALAPTAVCVPVPVFVPVRSATRMRCVDDPPMP